MAGQPLREAQKAALSFLENTDLSHCSLGIVAFADSVAERIADPVAEPIAEPFAEPQWFAFWTPFRSEIAANGFVGRLQSVTGLDYRVVKVKPGVYEVAFAYSEDTEIDSNLSTISAATGLDLPGAQ